MPEFETPSPVNIHLDVSAGAVTLRLTDTTVTRVDIDGQSDDAAAHTVVEMRGTELVVVGPRRSGLFRSTPEIVVGIEAPSGSSLTAELRAADLTATGILASARVQTGSGDIELDQVSERLEVSSGSGDLRVAYTGGGALRAGSGDVVVVSVDGRLECNTGSGDVELGRVAGSAEIRSGSGDVRVGETSADLGASTGSGDQVVGKARSGTLRLRSASGDVRVAVADGTAAWLDITTIAGDVHSALERSSEPHEGEARVAVHVSTVSGDVELTRS